MANDDTKSSDAAIVEFAIQAVGLTKLYEQQPQLRAERDRKLDNLALEIARVQDSRVRDGVRQMISNFGLTEYCGDFLRVLADREAQISSWREADQGSGDVAQAIHPDGRGPDGSGLK